MSKEMKLPLKEIAINCTNIMSYFISEIDFIITTMFSNASQRDIFWLKRFKWSVLHNIISFTALSHRRGWNKHFTSIKTSDKDMFTSLPDKSWDRQDRHGIFKTVRVVECFDFRIGHYPYEGAWTQKNFLLEHLWAHIYAHNSWSFEGTSFCSFYNSVEEDVWLA